MTLNRYCVGLAAVLLPFLCHAQEGAANKDKPKGWLRLLAVGEAPPFQQIIKNGIRQEVDPPKGSIPPRLIQIPVPEGEAPESLRLPLGQVSPPVLVPAGLLGIFEVDEKGVRGLDRWHSLKMPVKPAALALLWRDPNSKKWTRAKSMILSDDLKTFPPGAVRFVNVSPWNAAIKLGKNTVGLKPGQSVVVGKDGRPIKDETLQVAVADGEGGWKKVANLAVNQSPTHRSNFVIYRADGVRPRVPAKVSMVRERAVLPKLPPRKKNG